MNDHHLDAVFYMQEKQENMNTIDTQVTEAATKAANRAVSDHRCFTPHLSTDEVKALINNRLNELAPARKEEFRKIAREEAQTAVVSHGRRCHSGSVGCAPPPTPELPEPVQRVLRAAETLINVSRDTPKYAQAMSELVHSVWNLKGPPYHWVKVNPAPLEPKIAKVVEAAKAWKAGYWDGVECFGGHIQSRINLANAVLELEESA